MDKQQAENIFKAVVVFGTAAAILYVIQPKKRKSLKKGSVEVSELSVEERPYIQPPPLMDDSQAQSNPKSAQAHLALCVYIDAMNNGVSNEELDKVNKELNTDLGLKVYRRRGDDKLVVADLNGTDIMEYDAVTASQQS